MRWLIVMFMLQNVVVEMMPRMLASVTSVVGSMVNALDGESLLK